MTVGERIKAARMQVGLTQKELAEKLGVPYQSIGQWERGIRNPKLSSVRRIAEALDKPLVTLLPDDPEGFETGIGLKIYDRDGKIALTRKSLDAFRLRSRLTNGEEYKRLSDEVGEIIEDIEAHKDDPTELKLLQAYHKLNFEGQKKAIEQLELLLGNPKYSLDGDNNAAQE